jgi:hypothetical protein
VLTDACLYSLTVQEIMGMGKLLSEEDKHKLDHPATLVCKTRATVMEYDGPVPTTSPTMQDDLHALGTSIWMVCHVFRVV